jgi:hypothetical protein
MGVMRRAGPALLPALVPALLAVSGCGGDEFRGRVEDLPDPGLAFLAPYEGRRGLCQRLGVTAVTAPFVETGRDLVACPQGYSGGFELIEARGARQVGRTTRYTIYSVPGAPGSG